MAKNAKTNTNLAAAIAAEFADFAAVKRERVKMLQDGLSSLTGADYEVACDEIRACQNRAERAERFAGAMAGEKYANAVLAYNVTQQAACALQIYAQDKLHDTLRAIAGECRLSAVAARGHANMMTQTLIAALDENGSLTIGNAPKAMFKLNPHKSVGTYSAQASSSRQVLDLLGLLDWNPLDKSFKLNAKGEELRAIIAH